MVATETLLAQCPFLVVVNQACSCGMARRSGCSAVGELLFHKLKTDCIGIFE